MTELDDKIKHDEEQLEADKEAQEAEEAVPAPAPTDEHAAALALTRKTLFPQQEKS